LGISRKDVELLIHLCQQKCIPSNPFVAELGTQQLSNSFLRSPELAKKAAASFGVSRPYTLPPAGPSIISAEHTELLDSEAPFAREFWISLGFEYTAIDVDGSPGSIPLDLNYDQIRNDLRNKFGLVTNFGTTEHVCNQLNAFKIIHDLTAPGGTMMHHLPAGGMLNHGLVNYTPKFFWSLARSNGYKWHYMSFYGGGSSYRIPENVLSFTQSFDRGLGAMMQSREMSDYAILVALQKTLDIPFVAPLDVNTGARTNDTTLTRRYWTVFQPELLEAIRSGEQTPEWVHQPSVSQVEPPVSGDEAMPIRRAVVGRPGRRVLALVAAAAAMCTASIIGLILIVARLLSS
jgi:hypothetical protein